MTGRSAPKARRDSFSCRHRRVQRRKTWNLKHLLSSRSLETPLNAPQLFSPRRCRTPMARSLGHIWVHQADIGSGTTPAGHKVHFDCATSPHGARQAPAEAEGPRRSSDRQGGREPPRDSTLRHHLRQLHPPRPTPRITPSSPADLPRAANAGFIETKTIEQFFDPGRRSTCRPLFKGECPNARKDQYGDSCEPAARLWRPS